MPCAGSANSTASSCVRLFLRRWNTATAGAFAFRSARTNAWAFSAASSHRLVEIDACLIADDRINQVIKKLQSWIRDISTAIEHIEVVTGDESQQLVVVAQGSEEFVSSDAGECEKLTSTGGPLNGLIFLGRSWRQAWGQTSIAVRLSDSHSVSVEAEVFTQINPARQSAYPRRVAARR